jgi:hypothetical protein
MEPPLNLRIRACACRVAVEAACAQTAAIAATLTDDQSQPVEDAVVVAMPTDEAVRMPPRPREGSVDQVDQEFTPKVTAILAGTPVRFPNHGNIRRQTYSFSPAKRFELPPRAYTVGVGHPQLDAAEDTTPKTVDAARPGWIAVAWTLKLKREAKMRRAPGAASRGRY